MSTSAALAISSFVLSAGPFQRPARVNFTAAWQGTIRPFRVKVLANEKVVVPLFVTESNSTSGTFIVDEPAGSYNVRLEVIDNFGVLKAANQVVTISAPAAAPPAPPPTLPTPIPPPTEPTPTPPPPPIPSPLLLLGAFKAILQLLPSAFQQALKDKPIMRDKLAVEDGSLFAAAMDAMTAMVKPATDAMQKVIEVKGPVDPDKALATAATTAAGAQLIGTAIYLLATLTDLLHPLKGTGIVPTAISIVDKLGTGLITGSVVGTYARQAVEGPLALYYRSITRPFRPFGSSADELFFEDQISKGQWEQMYRWQGWPDDLIKGRFRAMFTKPSDRFILGVIEDPEVDPAWVKDVLKQRGYSERSIKILTDVASRRAKERLVSARETIVLDRFRQGYIALDGLRAELLALGRRQDQVDRLSLQAQLLRDSEQRRDRIAVALEKFQKDVINEVALTAELSLSIVDVATVRLTVELAKARKAAAVKDEQKVQRAVGASEAVRRYRLGVTTSTTQVQADLATLGVPVDERPAYVALAVLQRDTELKLEALKAAADTAVAKKATSTSIATRRFKEGFTDEQGLRAELAVLGASAQEISDLVLRAKLERDTEVREDLVKFATDAYLKDSYQRDEFIEAVSDVVADPEALELIVAMADLKKAPKGTPSH